jgi:hypothetical protein
MDRACAAWRGRSARGDSSGIGASFRKSSGRHMRARLYVRPSKGLQRNRAAVDSPQCIDLQGLAATGEILFHLSHAAVTVKASEGQHSSFGDVAVDAMSPKVLIVDALEPLGQRLGA